MRSTLSMECNLYVKLHTHLAAPVARDLAGKAYRNRSGDANHRAHEGYTSSRTWSTLGNLAISLAYALVSSGHLPLMMPMLLIAYLAEGLVARVSWAESSHKAFYGKSVYVATLAVQHRHCVQTRCRKNSLQKHAPQRGPS